MSDPIVGRSEGVAYSTYQIQSSISVEDINKFSELIEQNGCKLSLAPVSARQKLFICESKDKLNIIVESAENLLLQYTVKKYNDNLWHVTVVLD